MSADNWCKCPKCGNDFREDYEIGMEEDGEFWISYRGECGTRQVKGCGFKHEFKHKEQVK